MRVYSLKRIRLGYRSLAVLRSRNYRRFESRVAGAKCVLATSTRRRKGTRYLFSLSLMYARFRSRNNRTLLSMFLDVSAIGCIIRRRSVSRATPRLSGTSQNVNGRERGEAGADRRHSRSLRIARDARNEAL